MKKNHEQDICANRCKLFPLQSLSRMPENYFIYRTQLSKPVHSMDPISQACLGASLSQSSSPKRREQFYALCIGGLSGMAPDLDIFIKSNEDPLLFLEYHRQFTHSLAFIPIGALICALFFYPFVKSKLSFRRIYLFSFLGYFTHGLLDACTSYGTQLFWPFSNERLSWNLVSVVDPLFTLPVLVLILVSAIRKNPLYARISFVYALLFLSLGTIQKNRAQAMANELAIQRNHKPERINVKPGFANRHLWKIIYEYDGRYYIDAVKLLWEKEHIQGSSIQKLDIKRDLSWLDPKSQQAKDVERFFWFSDGFLALHKKNKNFIIDVRYSFLPHRIEYMWGILLNKNKLDDQHIIYKIKNKPDKKTIDQFFELLF